MKVTARTALASLVAVVLWTVGLTPAVNASPIEVEPFAALPFKHNVDSKLVMTSGWVTAEDELPIVGNDPEHWALDFEGPKCGTPVLAVASGWVVTSFQSGVLRGGEAPFNPDNPSDMSTDHRDPISGREGYIGYGGLFAELQTDVVNPETGQHIVAQYFHLGSVNPDLAWIDPVRLEDTATWDGKSAANWYPADIAQSQEDIRQIATWVEQGDVLGWLGDTGINFGYDDAFDPVTHTVAPRDRRALPPWDPQGAGVTTPIKYACELHIEFYSGRNENNGKIGRFDAFDLYAPITGEPGTESYDNPYNPEGEPGEFVTGDDSIFLQNRRGDLLYADQNCLVLAA